MNFEGTYKVNKIIKLQMMCFLTLQIFYDLGGYYIIEILLVLSSAYMILRDQEKFMFYVINYIDQDQFNQLYNYNMPKKA